MEPLGVIKILHDVDKLLSLLAVGKRNSSLHMISMAPIKFR